MAVSTWGTGMNTCLFVSCITPVKYTPSRIPFDSQNNANLIGKNTDTITIRNAKISRVYEEIVYKPHCFEGDERVATIMEILSGLESALTTGKYKKSRHGTYLVRRTN